jgi:hypothetical protein
MRKELIRQLVQEALQEKGLMNRPGTQGRSNPHRPRQSGPVVLSVFHPGVRKLDEALAQMKQIEKTAANSSAYTVDTARAWVCGQDVKDQAGSRCILDTVKSEGLEKVLQKADLLVLPTFCLKSAAKVARLMADDAESAIVLSALIQGKAVLAANDGFMMLNSLNNPGIRSEIERILAKLESFGMVMCKTEQLAATFQGLVSKKGRQTGDRTAETDADPRSRAKSLVTAKDIRLAANTKQDTIALAPRGLITPLARDQAKEYGIRIVSKGN